MTVQHVTDTDFSDIMATTKLPIVLDIWATWCGPCKMVTPNLEQIYAQDNKRFHLCLANLEEFQKTAKKMCIRSTPTLIIFKNGQEIARRSGAMLQAQIQQWLDAYL